MTESVGIKNSMLKLKRMVLIKAAVKTKNCNSSIVETINILPFDFLNFLNIVCVYFKTWVFACVHKNSVHKFLKQNTMFSRIEAVDSFKLFFLKKRGFYFRILSTNSAFFLIVFKKFFPLIYLLEFFSQ